MGHSGGLSATFVIFRFDRKADGYPKFCFTVASDSTTAESFRVGFQTIFGDFVRWTTNTAVDFSNLQ